MAMRTQGRTTYRRTEGRKLLRELLKRETQAAVAAAVGAKQQYVSRWARGDGRPEPQFRDALERVFGIASTAWYSAAELAISRGPLALSKTG